MSSFYTFAKQNGDKILFRGIKDGKRITGRHDFMPTLFVKSDTPSKYHTIFGDMVSPVKFGSNKEATEFVERYKDVSNFPIFGQTSWTYQYLTEKYPDEIDWDISKILIYSLDIETTSEHGFPNVSDPVEEVLLITVLNNQTKEITTFGTGDYTPTVATAHLNVKFIKCTNEKSLLLRFLDWWSVNCPDVVTGWNIQLFDIPYLVSRINNVLKTDEVKRLSPFSIVNKKTKTILGRDQTLYEIIGVAQLDYLELYRKFTYETRESYKLDFIAEVELGKKKLESGYDSFKEFYEGDWNGFIEYNIIDTLLVDELEDKMKLIELGLTMAYDAKCNYSDIYSPVRTWDCLLYNHLWKQDKVIHQSKPVNGRSIEGAYVQEPVPGPYDWVVSFDATSLYPSILMQYNMSPETILPNNKLGVTVEALLRGDIDLQSLQTENVAMAANGFCFSKTKRGIFPEIVQKFFDDRVRYKKLMQEAQKEYQKTNNPLLKKDIAKYNNFQMARKIQLNSLYGALANDYFRYTDSRIAEGITLTGQYIIQETAKTLDNFLNKVCGTVGNVYSFYSDTDSCYITLNNLVRKFYADKDKNKIIDLVDTICKEQIEVVINKAMLKLAKYTNAFEDKIFFKRESIADRAIWIAKKRYAMNVYDNEGVRYSEPYLKVLGLEIVRSSTPSVVRSSLKEALKLCLTSDEKTLHSFIEKTKSSFDKKSPEEIAFPRGCNNIMKYTNHNDIYSKGAPMHVRGSLLYNHFITKNKLKKKYELIQEGDKIKFLYLKEPNLIRENCIGFMSKLPEEFNIHKYVDYDMMFQKAFLDPMETIVKTLGWNTSEQATLEDLFS